jgi:phenylacetic acid degradation operon negative regulatory protein
VQRRTEELLNLVLWCAERLAQPTFLNFVNSYEGWAHRRGLLARAVRLENRHLLTRHPRGTKDRVYCLTEQGRLDTSGGRDPIAQWTRVWDGHWRLVLFDVPVRQNARREKLRRYLRSRGFGCLQGSVWITPDPVREERDLLVGTEVNVASLLFLEAKPCSGETDAQIVAGAWEFGGINRRYASYLQLLDKRPADEPRDASSVARLLQWVTNERRSWLAAVTTDPLLPERLLPRGYVGREAWERRTQALSEAGRGIRSLAP